jgi:hypothetical protein
MIERRPNGCWQWTGFLGTHGYGDFWLDGRIQRAHRAAYQIFAGPLPAGAFVCHRCDWPGCVNPAHLFLGDASRNMQDAAAKGRLAAQKARAC